MLRNATSGAAARVVSGAAALVVLAALGGACASSRVSGAPDGDPIADAPPVTPPSDARAIVHPDAGADAAAAGATDAAAGAIDATGCAISNAAAGLALDGTDDLAKYPAAQVLTPGAPLGAADAIALTWDRMHLYVTIRADAMQASYEPLHLYVETAGGALATAAPATGKEYGGLTPALPFAATHVIALRRVTDAGTGAYDGVFTAASSWATRAVAVDPLVSSDHQTVSAIVPWSALGGCPTALRLAAHVVHGAAANEWKDLVPATTTPWQAPGGGYYEIDLTQPPAPSGWTLR